MAALSNLANAATLGDPAMACASPAPWLGGLLQVLDGVRGLRWRRAEERRQGGQARARALVMAFETWLEERLKSLLGKRSTAKEIRYGVCRERGGGFRSAALTIIIVCGAGNAAAAGLRANADALNASSLAQLAPAPPPRLRPAACCPQIAWRSGTPA